MRFEPEFSDALVDADGDGRLLLIPLQLIGTVLAFALSPPALRAWHALSRNHA